MLDAAKVRTYATAEAFALGHLRVADVPVGQRDGLVDAVARELRTTRGEVAAVLASDWNETRGRAGQRVTGAGAAPVSSTTRRAVHGLGGTATSLQMQQLRAAAASTPPASDIARRADAIDRALRGDAAVKVSDDVPCEHLPLVLRRNVAFDGRVVRPGLDGAKDEKVRTGDYGAVVLGKIPDGDPILDLPIYRGMGSSDPAIHALRLTGKLIPGGTSGDYEGFKTYSNREPLDAFEWTLDPFVAMKGTGGHGYLLRTTLRELRDAGHKDVARKAGDSEGGIFIDGLVSPTARSIGHLPGGYALGEPVTVPADPQRDRYAEVLSRRLREHGGYGALIEAGDKLAGPLAQQQLRELRGQVGFWAERVAELDSSAPAAARVQGRLEAADRIEDPAKKLRALRALSDDLKLRAASLAPEPGDSSLELDLG